ncbi:MAG: ComEC/Rec2 family competence protein [Alistipes sp.]|nr:ComEC/Rec2 family competence protein [Alistipes sp.]
MKRASLTERLSKIPMAMVVIPFAMGIFFIDTVTLPLWVLLLACAISLAGTIFLSKGWQISALFVTLFSLGGLLHSISYRDDTTYNKPLEISLRIETTSVNRGGYTSAEAVIEACDEESLIERKVILWGDSLTQFCAGDRINIVKAVRPFRAERKQYARLMHHRGFVGSVSIGRNDLFEYIPAEQVTLHDWAVARLQSAMNEGKGRAVVLAMTTGDRSEISHELRQNYSASGASHLLAVSGLHIGIAFMLINILLLPLVLLRHGNVVRSIAAIVLIWLYVWLCGMSPSAVRAAIMFSLLQLSLLSLREYISVNILAGTAFAMLVFDTHLLFDISFQLSFIAVAGIVLWAMPIYRLCATRFKVVNSIIGILLVGIASTIATMPLVANTFSIVSLVGIIINPVVILLANIVVLAGVVALTIPSMAVIAEMAAEWQNRVVEWAASVPYGHFDISLSEGAMWGIYAIFAVVSIALFLLPKPQKISKIE